MDKGQAEFLQTNITFEVIIGVLIAAVLFFSIYNLNADESFTKTFLENDIDMIIGVFESSNKHIVVEYPLGKNDYVLKVSNEGRVIVEGKKPMFELLNGSQRKKMGF